MKKQIIGLMTTGAILISLAAAVQAAVVTQSTFDTNDEGWRVGDFFTNSGYSLPTYFANGGNPGGYINATDIYGWNAFHAPANFLGNQSVAYGGNLHIEQKLRSSDNTPYPMVVLSDNSLTLQFFTTPPGTNWTAYDIPLVASAGWEIANNGSHGAPASEAQLQQVLANLSFLHIDADWQTGSDYIGLDNVRLESVGTPLPGSASIILLFSGLAGFIRTKRNRK